MKNLLLTFTALRIASIRVDVYKMVLTGETRNTYTVLVGKSSGEERIRTGNSREDCGNEPYRVTGC